MTSKVGPKGQVVIPKVLRDKFGIQPGDRVQVEDQGGRIVVQQVLPIDELRGILGPPTGMADWEAHKREERELEERKIKRWTG